MSAFTIETLINARVSSLRALVNVCHVISAKVKVSYRL